MSDLRRLAAEVLLGQEVRDAWRAWQRGDTTLEQFLDEVTQSMTLYIDATKEIPDGRKGSVG